MNIAKAIVQLLLEEGKVNLPGLGQIERTFQSAELYRVNYKLTPPQYKLQFTEATGSPEKALAAYISKKEGVKPEESDQQVSGFIQSLMQQLEKEHEVAIPDVGVFRTVGPSIVFEPSPDSQLLADTVGFDSVYIQTSAPMDTTKSSSSPGKWIPANKTLWIAIAAGLLLIGCLVVLWIFFIDNKESKAYESSIARINKRSALLYVEPEAIKSEEETPVADSTPAVVQQIPVSASSTSSETGTRYYIVAGSFKNHVNAERMKTKLTDEGFTPEILSVGDSIYRVTMMTFMQRDSALREWRRLMSVEENSGLWLLIE